MTLQVHHYFPLGSVNLGDTLVARAIGEAVTRHFGAVNIESLPVNDRLRDGDRPLGLRGENLDHSNESADLVIVGGSNLLEPRRHGGWGVETDLESINRLKPPVLLLGMGTGSSFGKPVPSWREPARAEVTSLFSRAFASAVRDVTTERSLARIGVTTRTTGCPVTYLQDDPVQAGREDDPLLVSFPPPRITRRRKGRKFMKEAIAYLVWLQGLGIKIIVTLHDTRDLAVARQLVPPDLEIFLAESQEELQVRFKASRGVIGFRLHAALLGLGLGRPVIPVGVDWRGQGFIETFDLHSVSIQSRPLSEFRKLRALTLLLLDGDRSLIEKLDRAKTEGRQKQEGFLDEAFTRFSRPERTGLRPA